MGKADTLDRLHNLKSLYDKRFHKQNYMTNNRPRENTCHIYNQRIKAHEKLPALNKQRTNKPNSYGRVGE